MCIWDKVINSGLSKFCGQPLKNFNYSTLEYFVPYNVDQQAVPFPDIFECAGYI